MEKKQKRETDKKDDLVGIEQICEFARKDPATIMIWKNEFDFPIRREFTEFTFTWISSREKIKKWFEDRSITPKTAIQAKLQSFKLKELKKSGKIEPLNKELNGVDEIIKFTGYSIGTVVGWLKYTDSPIKKMPGPILSCDADELLDFMHRHNIQRGSYNLAPRGYHEF